MLVARMGLWLCLHLIGMSLAAALTYAFSRFTYAAYILDWSIPTLAAFFGLMNKALFMTLPMMICVSGLACMFLLLENLCKHLFSGLVIFRRVYEKYWLPTPPSHPRERLFYLKRVLIRQGSFYSRILLPLSISDGLNSDQTTAQPILSFYDLCSPRGLRLDGHTVGCFLYCVYELSLVICWATVVYNCSPCHKILVIWDVRLVVLWRWPFPCRCEERW